MDGIGRPAHQVRAAALYASLQALVILREQIIAPAEWEEPGRTPAEIPAADAGSLILQAIGRQRQLEDLLPHIRDAREAGLERLRSQVDRVQGIVGILRFPSPVHRHQQIAREGVVSQVLDAIVRVAGPDEERAPRRGRARIVHRAEGDRTGIFRKLVQTVTEQDLMVIVRAGRIAVDAISDIEVILGAGSAGDESPGTDDAGRSRPDRHAVYARAAETVLPFASGKLHLRHIVLRRRLDGNGPEHRVILGIHPDPVHLRHVDDGDIEISPFPERYAQLLGDAGADLVVLAFQRSVDAAVGRIERHRTQMPLDTVNRAQHPPLQVGADEAGREGIVQFPFLAVHRDALDMGGHAAAEIEDHRHAGGDGIRKRHGRRGIGSLRSGEQTKQQAGRRQKHFSHRFSISS